MLSVPEKHLDEADCIGVDHHDPEAPDHGREDRISVPVRTGCVCRISLLLSGKGRKSQIPLTWLTLQITYYNKPSINPVFDWAE